MIEYLYAGCTTLILFIILLVVGKKKKVLSDYIFIAWLVIMLANVTTFIVISRYGYPASLPVRVLVEFSEASVFVHGPVFLFYTLSLTSTRFEIGFRQAIHLVPFVVCFILLLAGIRNSMGINNTERQVFTFIKMISLLAYTSNVIIQLHNHRDRVERIFSNTESKYLGWLNFLAWGIIAVWVIAVVGLFLYHFFAINIPQYGSVAGNLALCGLIFLIGYFGLRQESIFNFARGDRSNSRENIKENVEPHINYEDIIAEEIEEVAPPEKTKKEAVLIQKYKNSGLTKQKSLELFETLTDLMQSKKPYQDSELTLFALAKQLKIHPNHLSQIINQHRNQNFFDYINEQRVNDVKKALVSDNYNSHSFLGIAHEFGFNSKASFNRAFKKFTGITPSEFKKTAL